MWGRSTSSLGTLDLKHLVRQKSAFTVFEKAFIDSRVSLIQEEELTLRNGVSAAQTLKCLSAMQETQVRFLGGKDPLEKEMAAHSSILAWKIPWTMEPGRLLSVGLQSWTQLSDFTFTLMECLLLLKGLLSKHSYSFWKMILVLHALLFLPGYRA